jgi:hypothetical protein
MAGLLEIRTTQVDLEDMREIRDFWRSYQLLQYVTTFSPTVEGLHLTDRSCAPLNIITSLEFIASS